MGTVPTIIIEQALNTIHEAIQEHSDNEGINWETCPMSVLNRSEAEYNKALESYYRIRFYLTGI